MIVGGIILAGILIVFFIGWDYYHRFFRPNVHLKNGQSEAIFIPTGSDLPAVLGLMKEQELLTDPDAFEWVARYKNYHNHVHAGKYLVHHRMNNNALVNLLRAGMQTPVNVTINNIRKKEDLAGKVAHYLETDSVELLALLNNDEFLQQFDRNKENVLTLIIPDTYEFYWNTGAEKFIRKMAREQDAFWASEKKERAKAIGLDPVKVMILAAIVQQETNKKEESARIAGVYMNRIKINMPLQADPTLVWALGDFTIQRVLDEHKQIESPYNTYKYSGLPPGPICLPEIHYIQSVLNYEQHNYLYFCAREDFSGYSNFAKTYKAHLVNARKYQRALNRRKIYQ